MSEIVVGQGLMAQIESSANVVNYSSVSQNVSSLLEEFKPHQDEYVQLMMMIMRDSMSNWVTSLTPEQKEKMRLEELENIKI